MEFEVIDFKEKIRLLELVVVRKKEDFEVFEERLSVVEEELLKVEKLKNEFEIVKEEKN